MFLSEAPVSCNPQSSGEGRARQRPDGIIRDWRHPADPISDYVPEIQYFFSSYFSHSPQILEPYASSTEQLPIGLILSIISFLKVIYWKLTVPVLPFWKIVFPRTLNLCREHTTKYSP